MHREGLEIEEIKKTKTKTFVKVVFRHYNDCCEDYVVAISNNSNLKDSLFEANVLDGKGKCIYRQKADNQTWEEKKYRDIILDCKHMLNQ